MLTDLFILDTCKVNISRYNQEIHKYAYYMFVLFIHLQVTLLPARVTHGQPSPTHRG